MSEKTCHQIKRPISKTQLPCDEHGNPMDYVVRLNCTRIEAYEKPGEYCYLPYIRVWQGTDCVAEFCQHRANFVVFGDAND